MIRASRLTARPLTARRLTAYKLGQQPVTGFDPLRLFSAGEDGTWLDFTTSQVYADTAGTDPAEVGEGIALTLDKSQGGELGPELVTNGDFSDGATGWTLGAGWAISGGVAAFNAGTGAELQQSGYGFAANTTYQIEFDMVQVSGGGLRIVVDTSGSFVSQYFTSTARHTLVFSVSASSSRLRLAALGGANFSIDNISIREVKGVHALQATSTARPIFRLTSGVHNAEFDLTDDILPITLPAITGGTVALVGLNGIWIEDNWDYAGGTLSIGPTTIAGLPAGILDVVGDLCAVIINDRAWTAAERAGVVAWGKARGAPGVFSLGEELVTNGTFDTDTAGWTADTDTALSAVGGRMRVELTTGTNPSATQEVVAPATRNNEQYLLSSNSFAGTVSTTIIHRVGTAVFAGNLLDATTQVGERQFIVSAGIGGAPAPIFVTLLNFTSTVGQYGEWDNVSFRKLGLIP